MDIDVPGEAGAIERFSPRVWGAVRAVFVGPVNFIRSSLVRQFVVAVVLANFALVSMLGWELVDSAHASSERRRIHEAETIAGVLVTSAAGPMIRRDTAELQRLADTAILADSVVRIRFLDAAGHTLAQTRRRPVPEHFDQPFVPPRFASNTGPRFVSRTPQSLLIDGAITVSGAVVGGLQLEVKQSGVAAEPQTLGFFGLVAGAGAVLLGGLIAFLTARSVTARLSRLAEVADRFRSGEHHVRLIDGRADEVGTVARGLNAMLETISVSEKSLKEVCRIAHIGSWRYAPSNPVLDVSETLHELFWTDPSIPPTAEFFLKLIPKAKRKQLAKLLEGGDPAEIINFNFTVPRPDSSSRICWAEARTECCPLTGEQILVGICQDITERESAVAQLRQAQKMEAVGQLTGGLAHDFNNLLAIVIGNLDLLEELSNGPDTREYVEEALAAALRGADLTRQLLAFSRRQSLSPQTVDLNRLVSEMAALWRRTLGEAIELRMQLAENLWPTEADPTQVESAVLNLVINARDAMDQGGILTVETVNLRIDEDSGGDEEEHGISAGEYAVIAVSDNGKGMSPDVAAQAFDPFFTTKAVGEGSGLGLSMIYGFAKQSGGAVRIYSEAGHGTTVRLYLPRASRPGETSVDAPVAPEAPVAAHETILLVEDNDSVRRVAKRHLLELGYSVLAASNGPEALELLRSHEGVDLLFTDVVMPGGMNGFELGKAATALQRDLKILYTSGFTRLPGELGSDPAEANVLLSKPYRKIDLALKLRQVLAGLSG